MLTLGQKLPGEAAPAKDAAKPIIYRPGKAPVWVDKAAPESRVQTVLASVKNEHDDGGRRPKAAAVIVSSSSAAAASSSSTGRRPVFKAEIVRGAGRPSSSSSVKRETIADSDDDGMDVSDDDQYQDDDAVRESTSEARPRVRAPAVVVDTKNLTVPKAEAVTVDSDEDEQRRARIKARQVEQRRREQEEAEAARRRQEENEDDGELSDEYEYVTDSEAEDSDDDEDQDAGAMLIKPLFVSKAERETLDEQARLAKQEAEMAQLEKQRAKERANESRQILIAELKQEEEAEEEGPSDTEMPDDTDDMDDESAIEAWKARERARLMRDKAEREAGANEKAEVERRRQMSDQEIIAENARLGLTKKKEKTSIKFMQKFFHRGAFYQDGDVIDEKLLHRDFNAATGFDKEVDMSMLPKVLQVKKFGLASRSKYTHLVDQDTSKLQENPWAAAVNEYGVKADPYKKK